MSYIQNVKNLGLKYVGKNVKISYKTSIYGASNISIGDNVRIDDGVILSAGEGGIFIGNNVHIAVYASLQGAGRIVVEDYANIAARTTILSSNDDYSGQYLIGPTHEAKLRNVHSAEVTLRKLSITGVGSIVLPGVTIGENTVLAALSMAKHDLMPNSFYGGVPCIFLKDRPPLKDEIKNLL